MKTLNYTINLYKTLATFVLLILNYVSYSQDKHIDPSPTETLYRLSFTRHVNSTITAATIDQFVKLGTEFLQKCDNKSSDDQDVACKVGFERNGTLGTFGTADDGLGIIDNLDEFNQVDAQPGFVKVVTAIMYNGDVTFGLTIRNSSSSVLAEKASGATRPIDLMAKTFVHEFGHAQGLFDRGLGPIPVLGNDIMRQGAFAYNEVNLFEADIFHNGFNKAIGVNTKINRPVDILFLIDDTGSMTEEIGGVKNAITFALSVTSLFIPNSCNYTYQLVTFKDAPSVRNPTTDLNTIKTQVSALFASGGGDCPEASAQALDVGKEKVRDGGIIFIATDASPHAGTNIAGITAAAKARNVKVFTILSGDCSSASLRFSQSPDDIIASSENRDSSGGRSSGGTNNYSPVINSRSLPINPTAIQAFSYISAETGGVFSFVPEINTGQTNDRIRYENITSNIIIGAVSLAITDLQPRKAPVNGTIAFTLDGTNTHFNSSTTIAFNHVGIEVKELTVVSPTQIIGTIKINPGVPLGFKDVTATSIQGGGITEIAIGIGLLEVTTAPTTPTILSISPATGTEGQNLTVKITGINTNFGSSSVINLGAGITILNKTIINSQELLADIQISPTASIGFRSVTVTTGSQVATENVVGPFLVVGFAGTNYYSKAAGNLSDLATWGSNIDGSGTPPTDFGSDKTFNLVNRGTIYTLTSNWSVEGIINIPGGSQLQINGFILSESGLTGTGMLTGSATSNLIVTGNGSGDAGIINFTANGNILNNLTINRPGTLASATLGSLLNLYGVLTVDNGTFSTGNTLILKSTAANTARVAPVNGSISGNVTVERYIPARRAWRLLAAPVAGTSEAANGVSAMTHSQETVQGVLTTAGGDPRPLSFGTATFSLNAAHTAMTFTATINNIDVTGVQTADANDNLTAAHIHVGAPPGANAPVRWGFFGAPINDNNPSQLIVTPFATGVGGTFSSTWDLPEGNAGTTLATNLPAILAGQSYINFHTVQFGGGEIRGQINLVGAGTQTINQAWQEGVTTFSANPNPAPGFGTHITQSASNGADGLDFNTAIAMSSLKRHQNPTNTWVPVLNTNTTLVNSNAWFIFVRGDRGINMGFNTVAPNNTTLRASGPLRTGDQTFPIAASGLTAIPNPYASPLNFASIAAGNPNIANSFTVVDPKLGSTGAFVTVSFNGVSYDVTPAAVSPIIELIQSGQGFLVQSTGVAGSITIKESDKSATAATNVFRTAGSPVVSSTNAPVYADPGTGVGLRVNLQVVNDDRTTSLLDEVFSSYKNTYSEKIDNMDAVKMTNNDENLGMERDGQTLILERRPLPTEDDIIPLKIWNLTKKTYLLEINPVNLGGTGLNAYLEDKYLKTSTPVSLDKIYQVYFSITTDAASSKSDRFQIILSRKIAAELTTPPGKPSITAFPNPITSRTISLLFTNKAAGIYLATFINSSGQTIFRKTIQHVGGTATQTLQLDRNLVKGVYQLQMSGKEGTTNIAVISN